MNNKTTYAITLLFMSVAILGSASVVGVLQSNETVSSSGIVVQPPPPPPPPPLPPPSPPPSPPPEATIEIDIYEDSGCTTPCSDVVWGSIEAGSSTTSTIYIKNNGDDDVLLMLSTEAWNPSNGADSIHLLWDYDGSSIAPNVVLEVILTLSVDAGSNGISDFSFDIVITGSGI